MEPRYPVAPDLADWNEPNRLYTKAQVIRWYKRRHPPPPGRLKWDLVVFVTDPEITHRPPDWRLHWAAQPCS